MSKKEYKGKKELFLKQVQLRGYKSIEDVKVVFEKGLNILIGKNASGKSNFLECLNIALGGSWSRRNRYGYAKLDFLSENKTVFTSISERVFRLGISSDDNKQEEKYLARERLLINDKIYFDNLPGKEVNENISIHNKRISTIGAVNGRRILNRLASYDISPLFIKFNLPTSVDIIASPATLTIELSGDSANWSQIDSFLFIEHILLFAESSFGYDRKENLSITKSSFLKSLVIDDVIISNLKKYSPIKDIRFSDLVSIYKEEKVIVIENLRLEFKLNNKWIPWSQLSDGTKRLFYLITEIANQKGGIVLVEEPELGVHPHQFNQVMEFLKEESESKQIIISTHSPQALNQLNEDELNNILVTSYDTKKGTQIKHLTKPQMAKAKKYMKEVGFLSDYWMLSDLE
ncbi:MAG: AAA family ATPase [Bacteroidetes bacterium]|nr:AAA family ATPase [Bacteroidota bacterium]